MKNKICTYYLVNYDLLTISKEVKRSLSKAYQQNEPVNDLIIKSLPLAYYLIGLKVSRCNLNSDKEEDLISKIHLEVCELFNEFYNKLDNLDKFINIFERRITIILNIKTKTDDIYDNWEKNELPLSLGYQEDDLEENIEESYEII